MVRPEYFSLIQEEHEGVTAEASKKPVQAGMQAQSSRVIPGCRFVDIASAVAWVTIFVVFRANKYCVPLYYGFHLLRTGISSELPGIRFWCLVHAALDFAFFRVTSSPPMIYFPLHIATHMALVLDLAKIAKRRVAGLASGRAMQALFDLCVYMKFAFVVVTTLREMKIIDWINPTFFESFGLAEVPPLDDMGGAVIFMLLATCSSRQYGGFIFALHLISASLIGPCSPGEVTCGKNVFNNMIWHQMTLLFAHQLTVPLAYLDDKKKFAAKVA